MAGSRTFDDLDLLKRKMNEFTKYMRDPIIITGGAKGADRMAMEWAGWFWYLVKVYYPNYEKYPGKIAPLKRNIQMAKNADYLVAFWDGKSKGTEHMIRQARKYGLKVKVVRFTPKPKVKAKKNEKRLPLVLARVKRPKPKVRIV